MSAIKPFTDRNGRPIQVGDTLEWTSGAGLRVQSVVTGYSENANERDPDFWERMNLRLPDGRPAYFFRHQTAPMISAPGQQATA
jgi:hypothetical protein